MPDQKGLDPQQLDRLDLSGEREPLFRGPCPIRSETVSDHPGPLNISLYRLAGGPPLVCNPARRLVRPDRHQHGADDQDQQFTADCEAHGGGQRRDQSDQNPAGPRQRNQLMHARSSPHQHLRRASAYTPVLAIIEDRKLPPDQQPDADLLVFALDVQVLHLATTTVLFALYFRYLPDARLAWCDTWFGAFLTASLFTIGKYLISVIIGQSEAPTLYDAAGSILVLMLWVYYAAALLLFGATFTFARGEMAHACDEQL